MARLRARHLLFAAITLLLVYQFASSKGYAVPSLHHSNGAPNAPTAKLARYMNDPRHIPHIDLNASSFAWNTVPFEYEPQYTPKLPAPVNVKERPRIQHRFRPDSRKTAAEQERRRLEVLRVFKKAWVSYKEKAWMKDALKPISGGYVDQFSGWAATLVDSLDTLWMMGLRDDFYEAVSAVATIDFGKSTSPRVNTFETCIRYLGGLIAAYDLSGHPVLRAKAIEVGDLLYTACE
jgi:mannosyl-oligosaccharide alpha-1,2-mannosidase